MPHTRCCVGVLASGAYRTIRRALRRATGSQPRPMRPLGGTVPHPSGLARLRRRPAWRHQLQQRRWQTSGDGAGTRAPAWAWQACPRNRPQVSPPCSPKDDTCQRERCLRWSKAAKSAVLVAASLSTRGCGGAPSEPASSRKCLCAQNRQVCPEEVQEPSAGAGGGHFDHPDDAAVPSLPASSKSVLTPPGWKRRYGVML